jgi:uncharacterized protein YndB with AHSA1/START domain
LLEVVVPVVERDIVLPVPRERAWELITEPDELREWLAEDAELVPEPGAPVRAGAREGMVEHVEAEERIVFTWGESVVEWRLEDHPAGTRFVVTEHRIDVHGPAWGPVMAALGGRAALCPA